MRIVAANLCYRFNLSDGWSRAAVAELLISGEIESVIPRWFDGEMDSVLTNYRKAPADFDCTGADYYAVYDLKEVFDDSKLLEHEIIRPISYSGF